MNRASKEAKAIPRGKGEFSLGVGNGLGKVTEAGDGMSHIKKQ